MAAPVITNVCERNVAAIHAPNRAMANKEQNQPPVYTKRKLLVAMIEYEIEEKLWKTPFI